MGLLYCFYFLSRSVLLLFEALMKLVRLQWKSLINKNLPSLMVYVHQISVNCFTLSLAEATVSTPSRTPLVSLMTVS